MATPQSVSCFQASIACGFDVHARLSKIGRIGAKNLNYRLSRLFVTAIILCRAFNSCHVEEGGAKQGAGDQRQNREGTQGDYHLHEGGGNQRQPRNCDAEGE